ncbi:hypothetical protein HDZ31DRAFT_38574 [Schizophyllum fasciatum]
MMPSSSLFLLAVLFAAPAVLGGRLGRDIIAARQFRYRRAPVASQVCLAINADNDGTAYTDCVCANADAESAFLDRAPADVLTNLGVTDAATLNALVSPLIASQITTQGTTCTYPDNSTPVCSPDNACAFTCPDGVETNADGTSCNVCTDTDLTFNPTTLACECPAPQVTCNGQCFPEGTTCPSPAPGGTRRRAVVPRKRKVSPSCEEGEDLCGISGVRWASECVNTASNVESCGGCMVPSPLTLQSSRRGFDQGVDCTQIANVEKAACEDGACVVVSCKAGFKPSAGFCVSV